MARSYNTTTNGSSWSDETILDVWEKGRSIPDYSPTIWRWDICGAVMKFSEHGNRESEYGWEIDHITPVSRGGSDNYNNLQPLNWRNNLEKADKIDWYCK